MKSGQTEIKITECVLVIREHQKKPNDKRTVIKLA